MGRGRIGVSKVKDIIRYHTLGGMSERRIGRALGVSRTAVANTIRTFERSGLGWQEVESMADTALLKALEEQRPPTPAKRLETLEERFPAMLVELKKKGMTLQRLWGLYIAEHPGGYQYSQFCLHFHSWRDAADIPMHIEHKAGEAMYCDWAGTKLKVIDARTGCPWLVEQFVAVLGASELTYVEMAESQQEEDWIRANERALWYWGGVPEALIPDCAKIAVTHVDPYEPGINPVFDDFASHYHLAIVPARARHPKDKALAEASVRLAYQRISCELEGKPFHSLKDLNEAAWALLERHNSRRFQRLPYSRRDLFEEIERSVLRPLPAERFPLEKVQWVTIGFNYHVELREDRHYYSVPYQLRRPKEKRKAKLVYDEHLVSIYFDNVRLAQYPRDRSPNGYTTLPEHMPPEHRWYAEWSGPRFLSWAHSLGPEVEEVIGKVLQSRVYAPQAYRVCLGILNLQKSYGTERLRKAVSIQ